MVSVRHRSPQRSRVTAVAGAGTSSDGSTQSLPTLSSPTWRWSPTLGVADPDGNPQDPPNGYATIFERFGPKSSRVRQRDRPRHPARLPSIGFDPTLITTTDKGFAHYSDNGNHVELGVYDRDQSIAYLDTVTALADPVGADMLAEDLGDLARPCCCCRHYRPSALHLRQVFDNSDQLPAQICPQENPRQDYPGCAVEALSLAVDTVEPLSQHIAGVVRSTRPRRRRSTHPAGPRHNQRRRRT